MPTSITVLDADGVDQTVATNDAIVAALAALATQTTLASILTALGSALPLPTGAATQTTLAAILTALGSALPLPTGAATQATLASVLTALQAAIPAGTNVIGGVHTNATRNAGALHRNAITAADKLAAGGTVTISAVTESGSVLGAAATYATICPYNRWGNGAPSAVVNVTPTANQAVRLAWAQVAGADGYDLFLGLTAGAPTWVGRVTEATRAAGGFIFSAVGVPTANAAPAGSIDIGIVGTGLGTTTAPFSYNNAYTPASVTPISFVGYSRAHFLAKVAVTDLRSLPTATLIPFFANQQSGSDWHQGNPIQLSLLSADGQSLEQDIWLDVDGSTDVVMLVSVLSGQGTAVSIWAEGM